MKRCAPRAHPTAKRAREAVETASSSAESQANREGSPLRIATEGECIPARKPNRARLGHATILIKLIAVLA